MSSRRTMYFSMSGALGASSTVGYASPPDQGPGDSLLASRCAGGASPRYLSSQTFVNISFRVGEGTRPLTYVAPAAGVLPETIGTVG